MAFEHRAGSFSLFKNDKGENDKRPDYRGEGKDMAGRDIEVAGWIRDGNKGKFMSCSFKLKEKKPESPREKAEKSVSDINSDIPFAPIGKGISGHSI